MTENNTDGFRSRRASKLSITRLPGLGGREMTANGLKGPATFQCAGSDDSRPQTKKKSFLGGRDLLWNKSSSNGVRSLVENVPDQDFSPACRARKRTKRFALSQSGGPPTNDVVFSNRSAWPKLCSRAAKRLLAPIFKSRERKPRSVVGRPALVDLVCARTRVAQQEPISR